MLRSALSDCLRPHLASATGFHWRRPSTWIRETTGTLLGAITTVAILLLLVAFTLQGRFSGVAALASAAVIIGMLWLPWQQARTVSARYARLPETLRAAASTQDRPTQARLVAQYERTHAQYARVQARLETDTAPAAGNPTSRPPRL